MKSLIFWSATALLVFGELMILRAWWAGRTPAVDPTPRRRFSEFAWIALPVFVLGVTLVATWRAQQAPNQPAAMHSEHAS
ncbi:MAG: hypothetical protein AB1762_15165 [Gemmatimonadota bacterium]